MYYFDYLGFSGTFSLLILGLVLVYILYFSKSNFNFIKTKFQNTGLRTHRFHLVDISPHPYLVSLSTFILLFGFVCWFNFVPYAFYSIVLPGVILILKCTIT
jgi:hypothetical protein